LEKKKKERKEIPRQVLKINGKLLKINGKERLTEGYAINKKYSFKNKK